MPIRSMPCSPRPYRGSTCASTRARGMNATVDALTDLERRLTEALSDALSAAECARLEFEARLAAALMAETAAAARISPPPLVAAVAADSRMTTTLLGFLGGIAAWFVTNFVAQPLLRFFTLRSEAAEALSMHRNVGPLDESFT